MSSLNKVMLIGRLGQEPKTSFTQNGKQATTFSIATSMKTSTGEITEWHNIIAWEKLAELAAKYLHKASLCYVEGRIQSRSWEHNGEKKFRTEIVAQNITFLSSNEHKASGQGQQQSIDFTDKPLLVNTTTEQTQQFIDSLEDIPF